MEPRKQKRVAGSSYLENLPSELFAEVCDLLFTDANVQVFELSDPEDDEDRFYTTLLEHDEWADLFRLRRVSKPIQRKFDRALHDAQQHGDVISHGKENKSAKTQYRLVILESIYDLHGPSPHGDRDNLLSTEITTLYTNESTANESLFDGMTNSIADVIKNPEFSLIGSYEDEPPLLTPLSSRGLFHLGTGVFTDGASRWALIKYYWDDDSDNYPMATHSHARAVRWLNWYDEGGPQKEACEEKEAAAARDLRNLWAERRARLEAEDLAAVKRAEEEERRRKERETFDWFKARKVWGVRVRAREWFDD
ncbi:uncharacterized protein MYCGRDRAFT_94806 [Zymoseptoria tritici IPO323]|uniref:F-box domain-containing protein n=1 Tax=Zymoseptoria tritici (strain CBS 115943 / IPO323) TaxID=336722 RepID=F9XF79_ZYMTI|nr:uncharacterized protein MYCGRDRAFT_94806 [Zymoseptoria tritici IPO323]EGP85880.1 hypothetical protein MYCGRDRAFT_94806 [Zymoseptoria tritici IPO323]